MEIPLQEIFALVSYIHADMENGVQLNPEWEETVEKVRVWAVACQQSVQPTLLTLCPECGVEQIVTHLPTCAHYVAQSG